MLIDRKTSSFSFLVFFPSGHINGPKKDIEIVNTDTAKITLKQSDDDEILLVCPVDKAFFVLCSGWASIFPHLTKSMYGLSCKGLSVGDIIMVAKTKQSGGARRHSSISVHKRQIQEIEDQSIQEKKEKEDSDDEQPKDLSIKRPVLLQ